MNLNDQNENGRMSEEDMATLLRLFQESHEQLLKALDRRIDSRLRRRIDPEDILAETFLKACTRWSWFKRSGMSFYAWLSMIAWDCQAEAWRRQNRKCRALAKEVPWPDSSSMQFEIGIRSSLTSASEVTARREKKEQLKNFLSALRPADREILWMHEVDGLSYGEIACKLGITQDAANQRYVRALRRARKYYGPAPMGREGSEL